MFVIIRKDHASVDRDATKPYAADPISQFRIFIKDEETPRQRNVCTSIIL